MKFTTKKSSRPGRPQNPGCAGLFLFLFGSVFAFAGIMAGVQAYNGNIKGSRNAAIIIPPLFTLIGIGVMIGGIAILRQYFRRNNPITLPGGMSTSTQDTDTFPAL